MSNQQCPELEHYVSIQEYHTQLWLELKTLFRALHGFCVQHQTEVESAVARAALFAIFGAIETSSRVLAAATLLANSLVKQGIPASEDVPQPVSPLTTTEELFLCQQQEVLDRRGWSIRRRSRFVSFEDALVGYPKVYARLFGQDFSIDKSGEEWQSLTRLKRLRDLGAHGNISIASSSTKSQVVTYVDLRELLMARRWYCQQLEPLPWVAGVEASGEIRAIDSLLQLPIFAI